MSESASLTGVSLAPESEAPTAVSPKVESSPPVPEKPVVPSAPVASPTTATTKSEQVLVFEAALLDKIGRFQGTLKGPKVADYLKVILDPVNLKFVDRSQAETDLSLKQVIPYTLLRKGLTFFAYRRTKAGGEDRLHDLWSIGVGGHINPIDGTPGVPSYDAAFARELSEEVGLAPTDFIEHEVIGLVNDDSSELGKVHFGIVHLAHVTRNKLLATNDPALAEGDFQYLSELRHWPYPMENWSRLVLEQLI